MAKRIEKAPDPTPKVTASGERFTAVLPDVGSYTLLSVHEFEGVKYQVVALAPVIGGVSIEFVRVQ